MIVDDAVQGTSIIDFCNILIGESQVTFEEVLTNVRVNSGDWQSAYTTVWINSAAWMLSKDFFDNSLEWENWLTHGRANSACWQEACTWGNHADAGYLTRVEHASDETDPIFTAHAAFGVTETLISNWTSSYVYYQAHGIGSQVGVAVPNKLLIVDSSKNLEGVNNLTIDGDLKVGGKVCVTGVVNAGGAITPNTTDCTDSPGGASRATSITVYQDTDGTGPGLSKEQHWINNTGATLIHVAVYGAGGGQGRGNHYNHYSPMAPAGGMGGAIEATIDVTGISYIPMSIGAGGEGWASGGGNVPVGTYGGNSYFGMNSSSNSTIVAAWKAANPDATFDLRLIGYGGQNPSPVAGTPQVTCGMTGKNYRPCHVTPIAYHGYCEACRQSGCTGKDGSVWSNIPTSHVIREAPHYGNQTDLNPLGPRATGTGTNLNGVNYGLGRCPKTDGSELPLTIAGWYGSSNPQGHRGYDGAIIVTIIA
jgi:hypothetical protein